MLEILEIIRNCDHLEQTVFISFVWDNMTLLRKLLPDQPLQYLTGYAMTEELLAQLVQQRIDLDIRYTALTQADVETLHAAGRVVNCWTVDDPATAERLLDWGVDFITSNILEYEGSAQ